MERASDELKIGEVARRTGLHTSAIRYYEHEGLLPAARREGGQRRYAPDVLQRLALIAAAQGVGFTIAEMRALFAGLEPGTSPMARWREIAERKLFEVETLLVRATAMQWLLEQSLRCGCVRMEDCALLLPPATAAPCPTAVIAPAASNNR